MIILPPLAYWLAIQPCHIFVPETDFYELHSCVLDLLDSNKNLLDSLFISNTKAEWNSSSSANVSHTKDP